MILFFGTKSGKIKTEAMEGISCPFCGQANTLVATSTPTYLHLFWISLFRISTTLLAQCSHCKKVFYETEFSEEMKEGTKSF